MNSTILRACRCRYVKFWINNDRADRVDFELHGHGREVRMRRGREGKEVCKVWKYVGVQTDDGGWN